MGVWLFDEGKGDDVKDSSGKGHDGKVIGSKWVSGKFGKALEFSAGNKVEIPHADEFIAPTFTLMTWIKIPKATGNWQLIVGKDGWPNRNYAMFIHQNSGALHCAFCAPGQVDVGNFNTPTIVADGEWHHVAFTYDMKMCKEAYIDGNQDAVKVLAVKPFENTVPIEIGRNLAGVIDEVMIANEPFSADNIKQAMEVGLAKFISGEAVSAFDKLAGTWGTIKGETARW